MTRTSYIKFLSNEFSRHFPEYSIKINRAHDDSRCFFVSIYGVAEENVDDVELKAYDIIETEILPQCRDFMPTPDVVDCETTQRHYPDLMPQSPETPKVHIGQYQEHPVTLPRKVKYECESQFAA